ncbi:BgTH12-07984 [Blumeria graminis f. sp. triticale]|uniref:Cytochrome b-c1 complex subunit 2, mitochondrial n=4 Tax=sordariomyceta TaxID=715989 RepID=A0A061HM33_BLUGR|nr:Subunit 2 of the ubiquinol cytochrome-c reductase complex [Blumeria graminis f. sp. tritici 96224]CAD6505707.1 BgTH12-07984 [Blumeria graminis f. sp. triticale]VDB93870.1 Bgt-2722 [Blumeria graminis f. sp. tritici]
MMTWSSTGTCAKRILRDSCRVKPTNYRTFAVAVGSAPFVSSEVAGVKIASRDISGPTTRLAVIAKAGTRYQPAPGLSSGLGLFAFKNTNKRSALRITREAELMGSQLLSYHTREHIAIEAKFMREDLPYFTELLAEVISETKYTTYEFDEQIAPLVALAQKKISQNSSEIAFNSVHGVAFHRGLGEPHLPNSASPLSKYLDAEAIRQFARLAYAKPNIAIVATGTDQNTLAKWVAEYFKNIPGGTSPLSSETSKYYGGEERIDNAHGNSIVIAFPGSSSFVSNSSFKPEIHVLGALLGGKSSIKWSTGFSLLAKASSSFHGATASTSHFTYSDTGLLAINIVGAAQSVRKASFEVYKALKSVSEGSISKDDLNKAIAQAKFNIFDERQSSEVCLASMGGSLIHSGKYHDIDELGKSLMKVSADSLKMIAKSLLANKATVSAVGDLHILPFAEEIGFKV